MKILLYNCDNQSLTLEDRITILEIENPKVLNGILYDITNSDFPAREIAIELNNELLKSKDFIFISDLYNITLSNKQLLTKIYKYLDKFISQNLTLKMKYEETFSNFAREIVSLFNDVDIDFDFSHFSEVKDLLSTIDLQILEVDNNIIEKLLQYIKICSELKLCKILFILNAKAFLIEDELLLLYKQALYYNLPLILIESKHSEKFLQNEQKVFIDEFFCDIILL